MNLIISFQVMGIGVTLKFQLSAVATCLQSGSYMVHYIALPVFLYWKLKL